MPLVLTNAPGVEPAPHASNGARLVSLTGKILPLRQITLVCDATGGVAARSCASTFATNIDSRWSSSIRFRCRPTAR